MCTGGSVTYTNNLFSGVAAVGDAAVSGDPLFVNLGDWPSGDTSGPALDMLEGVMIQAQSPAVNQGIAISDNGGFDFFGNVLFSSLPDIGPNELQVSESP